MKRYIQYHKITKRILSISDGPNKGNFDQKEITVTSNDLDKILNGKNTIFYIRNKLIFKSSEDLEEINKNKDIIKKIKSGKNTPEELATLLEKLINK